MMAESVISVKKLETETTGTTSSNGWISIGSKPGWFPVSVAVVSPTGGYTTSVGYDEPYDAWIAYVYGFGNGNIFLLTGAQVKLKVLWSKP